MSLLAKQAKYIYRLSLYTKSLTFVAMLMLMIMSGYNEGKALDWCNSCTTSPWISNVFSYTNTHCSSCNSIVNYQYRINQCNGLYEFKLGSVVIPAGCYSTCGADPYTEALYFLLIKITKERFVTDAQDDYWHTPYIMSTNSTCWSSRTITRSGLGAVIDTNLTGIIHITDYTSDPYSGTFTPNTSSATLSSTSATFETTTSNPLGSSNYYVITEPCGVSCCSAYFVVQKNPIHNGQTLDVFFAGIPTTQGDYINDCDSSASYQYASPCSYKCANNTLFHTWQGPFYKQNINFDIEKLDKSKLQEALIAPNPASNELKINLNDKIEYGKLFICNINGEILNAYKFDGSININISYLANGSYFYYISSNQDCISYGKFNIER